MRNHRPSPVLFAYLASMLAAAVGCSSGEDGAQAPATSQGGAAGASAAGSGGTAGTAGNAGTAGKAGSGGGKGGAAGAGGTGGKGGAAGQGGGTSGQGGEAGSGGGCVSAGDCEALLPATNPAGCAEAACEAGACVFKARDKDGDGKTAKFCKDTSQTVEIAVGNDCDDNDKTKFPGAWDGPEGEGNGASCDGVDNDCSGTADDNSLTDGTSCDCKPGAVAQCSENSSGKQIDWPGGAPAGECKYGSKTCAIDVNTGLGKWGSCTDAVVPSSEVCDTVDNDCDGLTDDQDPDVTSPEWTCDGDNDDEASPDAKVLKSCNPPPAEECPGPNPSWKIKPPKTDCDDTRPDINKKGFEVCDEGPDGLGNDENCDGQKNENCACKNGSLQSCFTDPNGNPIPSSEGKAIGACKAGTQTCNNGQWGTCLNGQGPLQEVCANIDIDNDCDGDSAEADDKPTYRCDKDSDGFLSTDAAQVLSITLCGGAPAAGSNGCIGTWRPEGTPATDCDDSRADVNKNAPEVCDAAGADENCDDQKNEGCGCTNGATQSCFTDPNGNPIPNSGGKAIGACKAGTQTCGGGQWGTCLNGQGPTLELCANVSVDNDCDGDSAEADDKVGWWCDGDSDGFAKIDAAPVYACSAPGSGCPGPNPSWKQNLQPNDCNDSRADVNKNAPELCAADGADENCDGQVNETTVCSCTNGSTRGCWKTGAGQDIPHNGNSPIGACKAGTETCLTGQWGACLNGVGPSGEFCSNINVDNDCDGDVTDADDKPTYFCDKDSDGFLNVLSGQVLSISLCGGAPAAGSNGCTGTWRPQGTPFTDCNDNRADVNKNAPEVCAADGADENCNNQVNEGCGCTNGATQSCFTDPSGNPIPNNNGVTTGQCKAGTQTCGSGQWGTCVNGVGPSTELCANLGVDNDCDGDTTDANDKATYYCDPDSDGYLAIPPAVVLSTQACSAPAVGTLGCSGTWRPASTPFTDCNPTNNTVYPNAPELCTATDENCNGNNYDGWSWPNGQPFGAACTNGLLGSCYKTGTNSCASASSAVCNAGTWGDVPSTTYTNVPVHNSYDRNCDGKQTYQAMKPDCSGLGCSTPLVNYRSDATLCTVAPSASECNVIDAVFSSVNKQTFHVNRACSYTNIDATNIPDAGAAYTNTLGATSWVAQCGALINVFTCSWSFSTQTYTGSFKTALAQACQ